MKTVLITGAYGYLGSVLRRRFDAAGWKTVALVRAPRDGDEARPWKLGEPTPEDTLLAADALIHCAWDLSAVSRDEVERVNVGGSVQLLTDAADVGVPRIVFVSSMSAYEGTKQAYGQAKLTVERATLDLGGVAVRPGLVYGADASGMAGTLRKLARLPLVPVMGGRAAHQFPVHEDDLASVIQRLVEQEPWLPEAFGIAQAEPVSFQDLLAALAEGRRPRFVPVPWRAVLAGLLAGERLGLKLPVRSDSIYGLVRPAPSVPPSRALPDLQLQLRRLGHAQDSVTATLPRF